MNQSAQEQTIDTNLLTLDSSIRLLESQSSEFVEFDVEELEKMFAEADEKEKADSQTTEVEAEAEPEVKNKTALSPRARHSKKKRPSHGKSLRALYREQPENLRRPRLRRNDSDADEPLVVRESVPFTFNNVMDTMIRAAAVVTVVLLIYRLLIDQYQ